MSLKHCSNMTAEVDLKIVKIESEEECKVNLCVNSQRYLVVNNDIKEEFSYEACNANLNKQYQSEKEENSNRSCVSDIKEEVGCSFSNIKSNKFENYVGDQEEKNDSDCDNQNRTKYDQIVNNNSAKLLTGTIYNHDEFVQSFQKQESNFKYKCDQCDFSTKWKSNLTAHYAKHNGTMYNCEDCEYSTYRKDNLKKHCAKHKGITYKCDHCDFSTYRKNNLIEHSDRHKGITYKCGKCDFSTIWRSNLRRHSHIRKEVIHKCEQCDYSTKSRSSLIIHHAKHKGIIYNCKKCDYSTYAKDILKRHSAIHKGIVYSCEQCDYSTYIKRNLTRHSGKHNGRKL